MPIASLDSGGGPAVLVFICDNHPGTDLTLTGPWLPSVISAARREGWIVNAREVLCCSCTGKLPSFFA